MNKQILGSDWCAFTALRQGNTGQWGKWIERKFTHQAAPWNGASGITRASTPTSLQHRRISLGFQSRLAVAEGKPQPSEWPAPTWLTHGKWQSTHAAYSLPWHLNSRTEEATGNPSSYPLSPARLPAQRTEETKCLHSVQGSSRNLLETEMGRLDSVSWVSTSRSFIIRFQVLWDTKTQNLFELGTECDPSLHFTKKRHQSLTPGHVH